MATEIAKESVAQTLPQGTSVPQAADVISGILNSAPEAAKISEKPVQKPARQHTEQGETPDEIPGEGFEEVQDAPSMEAEAEKAPEAAPEVAEESKTEVSEGDADEIELEPAQLAAFLGLQENDIVVDDSGALSVRTKVDGAEATVALSDLRDSYQLTKTAQQRLSKLGEERKAFDTQRAEAFQELQQQAETMAQTIGQIEQEYAADWQGVDWNRLKEEDPTSFNLKRSEFSDREKRLGAYREEWYRQVGETRAKHQAYYNQLIDDGKHRLEQAMMGPEYANAPAWNDSAKTEVTNFMLKEGIPQELISTTPVWQAFNWARKAMLYDQMMTQAKTTAKRVVKLPKVSKPGAQSSKAQVKSSKIKDAKFRQRKAGGTVKATAETISAILRGG